MGISNIMQLKFFLFIAATTQALAFTKSEHSCINCVESEGLLTCDRSPGFCLPGVTACVSMQVTQMVQPNIAPIYWRGCEMPGHEDIPDGCTCEGEVGFYCKKTCFTDNCNDDESLSTIDQVVKYSRIGSNSEIFKEFE